MSLVFDAGRGGILGHQVTEHDPGIPFGPKKAGRVSCGGVPVGASKGAASAAWYTGAHAGGSVCCNWCVGSPILVMSWRMRRGQ